MSTSEQTATARLAASWLLWYPDQLLRDRLPGLTDAVAELPDPTRVPLQQFLSHLGACDPAQAERDYVATFDMRRRASLYLTYWTHGDTRNRGRAILHFKQAYLEAGFDPGTAELPDHLAVALEFAAVCGPETGQRLLVEHTASLRLLQAALERMSSPYRAVIDSVLAELPEPTAEQQEFAAGIAGTGPPVEQVGLEPFAITSMGARP